jgi:hypothetical protein
MSAPLLNLMTLTGFLMTAQFTERSKRKLYAGINPRSNLLRGEPANIVNDPDGI